MLVELNLFSGRPNPTWRLTAEESSEFLKRFAQLRPTNTGRALENLGYRGLIVTGPAGTILGFDNVEISSGLVVARSLSVVYSAVHFLFV